MPSAIEPTIFLFFAIGVTSLALGLRRLSRGDWNVLDPVVTFAFGFSIYYGFSNAWYCVQLQTEGSSATTRGWQFDPSAPGAMALLWQVATLTALFGAGFALGALVLSRFGRGRPRSVPRLSNHFQARANHIYLILLPMSLWGWSTQLGFVPSLNGIAPSPIVMIPKIGVFGLAMTVCYHAARGRKPWPILLAVAVVAWSALIALPSAMKEEVLSQLLAGLAGVLLAERSWRPIAFGLLAGLPFLVVLNLWVSVNRSIVWETGANLDPISRLSSTLGVGMTGASDAQAIAASGDGIMYRLCTAIPMAETVLMIGRGESLGAFDGLVGPLVPRVLWPDKPAVDLGERLYAAFSGNAVVSSNSPNLPAESFMYGGWFGVAAAGLMLGASAGILGSVSARLWASSNVIGLAVLIPVALLYAKCENWLHQYPALLLSIVPLLVAAAWLTRVSLRLRVRRSYGLRSSTGEMESAR